ncbi:MAG: hypothetical protein ACLR1T_07055 [Evtepia gabavorous]
MNQRNGTSLTAEEVYLFTVRLCDNQTDRDQEYFSRKDMERLAELFVGKTGIFDHNWSARDQRARIYRTELVEEPGMRSEAGEPGCYLKGYAYMLRTQENEGLIAEIAGGIKKEVSVSCAVSRCVCSICGHDIHDRGLCSHVKGRTYEGKRCIARLADPTDAFEWSFVAVPAQPRSRGGQRLPGSGHAGTAAVESGPRGPLAGGTERPCGGRRRWGGGTWMGCGRETVRLGLLAEGGPGGETLRAIADRLEEPELEQLRACYARRLEEKLPMPVQLRYDGERRAQRQTTGPL